MSVRLALFAALALLAGCERTMPVYIPPVVEVQGVRQVFTARPGSQGTQRLIVALRGFVGGRMDALHVALPPGPAMDRLAWQLRLAGVMPRKLRRDVLVAPGTIVATRYLASVAPCPALDFRGATLSRNGTRPGFGCATVADLAAQTSDPADLLGNDAAPAPYADRAALPVARWLGFSSGAAAGGGSSGASSGGSSGASSGTSSGASSATSSGALTSSSTTSPQ